MIFFDRECRALTLSVEIDREYCPRLIETGETSLLVSLSVRGRARNVCTRGGTGIPVSPVSASQRVLPGQCLSGGSRSRIVSIAKGDSGSTTHRHGERP